VDAIDPVAYVRATPPFHALPQPLFDAAVSALEVGFYPAGTWLVRAGGAPLERLYVIRKGAVRLERDGQPVQVLEDGETFGYTSLITREATLDVVVEEDLLAYELPDAEFQRLRTADAGFASHFAVGLAERLKNSLEHSPVVQFQADLSQEIGRLVRRPPVWVEAGATVLDAARLMRAEGISSVLVRSDPPGIVTDRDFANRVLAAGLGPGTPLAEVASRPLRTLAAETPMHEAWTSLLESGAHHLPVTRGWAEADLGAAPAPWAWLVFGSEGRREQTLLTDQDNALVYADAGGDHRPYFQAFAERVNADLEAAGYPRCQAGHMARLSHGTLSEWTRRYNACIDERRPHAAALLFDFRKVGGALDVTALDVAMGRAQRNPLFLRFLARTAR